MFGEDTTALLLLLLLLFPLLLLSAVFKLMPLLIFLCPSPGCCFFCCVSCCSIERDLLPKRQVKNMEQTRWRYCLLYGCCARDIACGGQSERRSSREVDDVTFSRK